VKDYKKFLNLDRFLCWIKQLIYFVAEDVWFIILRDKLYNKQHIFMVSISAKMELFFANVTFRHTKMVLASFFINYLRRQISARMNTAKVTDNQ
jgi:hypothetical protein